MEKRQPASVYLESEVEFWKRRASRLRFALLDISGGCDDPKKRAADAIEAERDAREAGK